MLLEPPPRPCTKMKSISGSEGEWRRFNPRGPFESSTPSSVTVVTIPKRIKPDPNVLCLVGRAEEGPSLYLRCNLRIDYARSVKVKKEARSSGTAVAGQIRKERIARTRIRAASAILRVTAAMAVAKTGLCVMEE